jgi:hypothetical protein
LEDSVNCSILRISELEKQFEKHDKGYDDSTGIISDGSGQDSERRGNDVRETGFNDLYALSQEPLQTVGLAPMPAKLLAWILKSIFISLRCSTQSASSKQPSKPSSQPTKVEAGTRRTRHTY